jgi:hypothetical protein
MSDLREFASGILERHGAVVEACEPDGLDVLAPPPVQRVMGWREFERLDFRGAQQELPAPARAVRIGLEGDWLERFGALLGDGGHWAERQLPLSDAPAALSDPERMLGHTLDLPNAVWRLEGHRSAMARCIVLAFRYAAVSDEKREGLVWLGFNQSTGAVIDSIVARLLPGLLRETAWQAPDAQTRDAAGPRWDFATLEARLRPLLEHRVRRELDAFLRAMQRRLERDRARVHAYHDDLWASSQKRLAALAHVPGEKAQADRRREQLRVAAIEREYRNKLGDLGHNYALRVRLEFVQALELYVPVQRCNLLVRRRKGERRIALDWHPSVRMAEPPLCEWGLGLDTLRVVCDDHLHVTEPEGQAPCAACGRPFCRACHPAACPRCAKAQSAPIHASP